MAHFKLGLFLLACANAFLLLSNPVRCDDVKDTVLNGINSFRQSLNLPTLTENDKASCLADDIADQLEDLPCENAKDYYPVNGSAPNFPNFQKLVKNCGIDMNSTQDGVIMPVCVHKLDPTVVLSNITNSHIYAHYLKDSKYTGVGLGKEDDWMVVILSTDASTGSFSRASSLLANMWMCHCMVAFFMGFLVLVS